jgi:hypothetical protein
VPFGALAVFLGGLAGGGAAGGGGQLLGGEELASQFAPYGAGVGIVFTLIALGVHCAKRRAWTTFVGGLLGSILVAIVVLWFLDWRI